MPYLGKYVADFTKKKSLKLNDFLMGLDLTELDTAKQNFIIKQKYFPFQPAVADYDALFALPEIDNVTGHIRLVLATNELYIWKTNVWIRAGTDGSLTNYLGYWDASTNTPVITSSVGSQGDFYYVNVAGSTNIDGKVVWNKHDYIFFNQGFWFRIKGETPVPAEISELDLQNKIDTTTDYVSGRRFWQGFTTFLSQTGNVFANIVTFTLGLKLSNILSAKLLGTGADGTIQAANLDTLGLPVTVGTGGDYATFSAAVTAGKYNLIAISNFTEVANVPKATLVIRGLNPSIVVNMNNFVFLNDNIGTTQWISNITLTNCSFGNYANLVLNNCVLSEGANKLIRTDNGGSVIAKNCTFNLANRSLTFMTNGASWAEFIDCIFVGGGTSCTADILGVVKGCTFSGSWDYIYNLYYISNCTFYMSAGYVQLMDYGSNAANRHRKIMTGCTFLSNIDLKISASGYVGGGNIFFKITGCNLYSISTSSSITGTAFLSNCTLRSTITGNTYLKYKLNNCASDESITVNSPAWSINNCEIGSTTGGVKTIIINSGVGKCNITNNTVELNDGNGNAVITDNSGLTTNNIQNTQCF